MHLLVTDVDLFHPGVVPDIPAQFPDLGVEGQGDLVGAVFGKPGQLGQIHIGHKGIGGKAHLRGVGGDIGPVRLEDLPGLVGHADLPQHLIAGLGHQAHQIVVFQHHFDLLGALRLVVPLVEPLHAVHQHPAQFHDGGHGLPAAGDLTLHLVNEVLHPGGHGHVEAVRVGGDGGKALVGAAPLHVQTVLILQQLADGAPLALALAGAHLAQLMEGGLKFIIAAHKTCGTATGKIVLFQHQHLFPGFRQSSGGG